MVQKWRYRTWMPWQLVLGIIIGSLFFLVPDRVCGRFLGIVAVFRGIIVYVSNRVAMTGDILGEKVGSSLRWSSWVPSSRRFVFLLCRIPAFLIKQGGRFTGISSNSVSWQIPAGTWRLADVPTICCLLLSCNDSSLLDVLDNHCCYLLDLV